MEFQLTQLVAPAAEPITLADAKSYLRLDDAVEDALVLDLIAAARASVERATGRSLLQQDWQLDTNMPDGCFLPLPRGPVSALQAVLSVDEAGNETALDPADYELAVPSDRLRLRRYPLYARLRVKYRCGAVSAADVPAPLRQAVRALVLHLYEARDVAQGVLPGAIAGLIAPFRFLSL